MNNKIKKIIETNDIHITVQDIVEILINKYNLKNYIQDINLDTFDNDTLGLYNFNFKSLTINKNIINILDKFYQQKEILKKNLTREEFITFEILQTIIHETMHANQNKIIIEEKGIIHKVYKDVYHTPGRNQELYELDPLEKDADLSSYEYLFPYYKENEKIYNFIKNAYTKAIYRGYLNKNLSRGSLEKLYKLFLLKEDKFKKLTKELDKLDYLEKLHINYSLKDEEIQKIKVK